MRYLITFEEYDMIQQRTQILTMSFSNVVLNQIPRYDFASSVDATDRTCLLGKLSGTRTPFS